MGKKKFKGHCYVTVGIPGSGKTTWADRLVSENPSFVRISLDDCRKELGTTEFEQVKELFDQKVTRAISEGKNLVIDNTNCGYKPRANLCQWLSGFGYKVTAVYFRCSIEESKARMEYRGRIVPEDICRNMLRNLLYNFPRKEEHINEIVRVEDLENQAV